MEQLSLRNIAFQVFEVFEQYEETSDFSKSQEKTLRLISKIIQTPKPDVTSRTMLEEVVNILYAHIDGREYTVDFNTPCDNLDCDICIVDCDDFRRIYETDRLSPHERNKAYILHILEQLRSYSPEFNSDKLAEMLDYSQQKAELDAHTAELELNIPSVDCVFCLELGKWSKLGYDVECHNCPVFKECRTALELAPEQTIAYIQDARRRLLY